VTLLKKVSLLSPFVRKKYKEEKSSHEPTADESPDIDFTSTYFKIGFWDGLSPKVGGGLFFCPPHD
jgi:hypothetical protein